MSTFTTYMDRTGSFYVALGMSEENIGLWSGVISEGLTALKESGDEANALKTLYAPDSNGDFHEIKLFNAAAIEVHAPAEIRESIYKDINRSPLADPRFNPQSNQVIFNTFDTAYEPKATACPGAIRVRFSGLAIKRIPYDAVVELLPFGHTNIFIRLIGAPTCVGIWEADKPTGTVIGNDPYGDIDRTMDILYADVSAYLSNVEHQIPAMLARH